MNAFPSPVRPRWTRRLATVGMGLCVSTFVFAAFQGPKPAPLPPGTTRFPLVLPPGIPQPPVSPDNPLTVQGVALGDRLFSDPILSDNGAISCSSCHTDAGAHSDPGKAFSLGAEGQIGVRNSMSLMNVAFAAPFFWDGRAATLRIQSTQPIENPIEMHGSLAATIVKLQADPTYPADFKKAFGSPGITTDRIQKALEQYMDGLLSGGSAYDLSLVGKGTLTASQERGRKLFFAPPSSGKSRGADCARCHGGPTLSDHLFHNTGLDAVSADPGRYAVTGNPRDLGAFKTPTLRNLEVTGPYMHDGRFKTLAEVVDFYSGEIQNSKSLDPGLAKLGGGLGLTAAEKADLIAFLKSLRDPQFAVPTP